MTKKSLEIAREILNDVLNSNEKNNIKVPIGLNVEHIMSYNFSTQLTCYKNYLKYIENFVLKLHFMISSKPNLANILKEEFSSNGAM